MKKYSRWIIFGATAAGLITLLLLVGTNKKLRQKITILLLEKFVKNKVGDLKEQAIHAQSKAEAGTIKAEEAEQIANNVEQAISQQKENLQKKYEDQGMSANEISNRFNNINI